MLTKTEFVEVFAVNNVQDANFVLEEVEKRYGLAECSHVLEELEAVPSGCLLQPDSSHNGSRRVRLIGRNPW